MRRERVRVIWNLLAEQCCCSYIAYGYSSAVDPVAYSTKSIWLCRIQGFNFRSFMWIEFLSLWIQFLSLPALLTITTLTNQWRIGVRFQFRAVMPKVVQRCVASISPREAWKKKKSPSFFTFQDGLSWHIHALHCYLVHDIVLIKLWWRWRLENYKINTKSHEVRSSASLAS